MVVRVFVTGAFGNVGQWVILECVEKGYEVIAYDIKNKSTLKKYKKLVRQYSFTTIWGDLTDEDHVKQTLLEHQPDNIIHVAAIIAPTAYVIPKIAYAVNVLGSLFLIEGAGSLDNFSKFIFVSSYTVHGPRNPYSIKDKITGDTPVDPRDSYGRHKVAVEKMLEESSLQWTIIRLPAVFSLDSNFGRSPEFLKFGFMLDPQRNEHAIDPRDAGLALVNAVSANTVGMKFDIGGDPEMGWSKKALMLQAPLFRSKGLQPAPESYYRRSDPENDESWYYEDYIDTNPSQEILQYQRISFQEHYDYAMKQLGFTKYFMKLVGPLVKRHLRNASHFVDEENIDSRPLWDVVKELFDLEVNHDIMIY